MIFAADPGFVEVPTGSYLVGNALLIDNHRRTVKLQGYKISKYDVTNRDFAEFVRTTGYVTDAERVHNAEVFRPGLPEFKWFRDRTASWRYPNGKSRGGIEKKWDHPVTTISYQDALAYCKWAKVRLPTLEEWEVACRAGTTTDYFFGDKPEGVYQYANVWHARNHLKDDTGDPYLFTSPVGSFKPNPWGLYDMYGNVFQFCSGRLPGDGKRNLAHARGGSWWCARNVCCFFNSVDIGRVNPLASFSNQGFRVVKDVPK